MDRKIGRIIEAAFLVLLVIFAFWMTLRAGERGLFGFDQSIVFDGGYRVLLGQVPYRDFIIPIGPVVFWIQALFFACFGVDFHTCILAAAFFNAMAALLTVGIIKLLFPGRRVIPCAAGFLTAVWFYPPFGTLYYDQTAFFFSLLALYVLLLSMLKAAAERPFLRPLLLILAGVLALASFLSKQNAGLFFLPFFPLLILANGGKRVGTSLAQCAVFFGALLAAFAAFLAWVHVCSDLSEFLVRFFKVPAEIGVERIFRSGGLLRMLGFIYTGDGPVVTRLVVAFSCLLSAFVLLLYFSNRETLAGMWRRLLLAACVCLYCSFYQYFFLFSTKNQPENCLPFLGAIFGIGACLAIDLLSNVTIRIHVPGRILPSPGRMTLKRMAVLFLAILFLYSLERGRALSLQRSVHEIFAVPLFNERLSVPGLDGLKWGKYTKVQPEWNFLDMEKGELDRKKYIASPGIEAADLVSLVDYLKKQGAPFFVFPDHTILYGLLGAAPPQPLLWFHRGLTYPMEYEPELDERIVLALRKNDVETVILEEDSFFGAGKRLNDFPLLKAYIDDRFTRTTQFGIFILYEKNKPEVEPGAPAKRK